MSLDLRSPSSWVWVWGTDSKFWVSMSEQEYSLVSVSKRELSMSRNFLPTSGSTSSLLFLLTNLLWKLMRNDNKTLWAPTPTWNNGWTCNHVVDSAWCWALYNLFCTRIRARTRKFLDISITWKFKQFCRPSNFKVPAVAYLVFCISLLPRQSSAWKSGVPRPLSNQAAEISRVLFRRNFGKGWVAETDTEIAIPGILLWILFMASWFTRTVYINFRFTLHFAIRKSA